SLLSRAWQRPIGSHRPAVFRRHRTACAGVLRRPVLATRDRARRDWRHADRVYRVDLHPFPAELPRRHGHRPAAVASQSVRYRSLAATGSVRRRSAAASSWRALVAFAQPLDLCRALARAPAVIDRTPAGGHFRAPPADADDPDAQALAYHRDR